MRNITEKSDGNWIPLTGFEVGYSAEPTDPPSYKILSTGEVIFKGGIARNVSAPSTGTLILTLPTSITPLGLAWFVVNAGAGYATIGFGYLTISSNGALSGFYSGDQTSPRYFHLSQLRYSIR